MKAITKIWASLLAATLLVLFGATVSFWMFAQIEDAAAARKHTRDVIDHAEDFLSEVKDAETGQRGFCLTGDEKFLEPYLRVRDVVDGHLRDLRQLTFLVPAQQHVDALVPLLAAKMGELEQVIALRRAGDLPAMLERVRGGEGKRLMELIRAEVKAFVALESEAQTRHDVRLQANLRYLFVVIAVASLVTLLLALLATFFVNREAQHRLKDRVLQETKHLLLIQEQTNEQLKQANVQLRASEDKLAITLHSIGDGVVATDAAGLVTFLNPVAEMLCGWKLADAAGRPAEEIFRIINEDTREPFDSPIPKTLAEGTTQGLANHTLLVARDGSECPIADSCAPIRDRAGVVLGAVLVFRDVTKEHAAQQAARDSAALIRTILNTVADGIVTVRADRGLVESANPAAEQMFGFPPDGMRGLSVGGLLPQLENAFRRGELDLFRPTDAAQAAGLGREVEGLRRDGGRLPLEVTVTEMALGGQRHFTVLLRDITTRKHAEEALRKAGALQAAIFNSANFSSIATDAKGVIQIFNVGAERMLGFAAADVVNRVTPADLSDPEELVARAKVLSAELSTPITPGFEALVFKASRGIEDIYELTYIRKNGTRLPAVVSVTALRDTLSTIIGYLLIGTDNTARKEIEAEQTVLGQRLRDQQFYTRSLFESNIDALMTTDPAGIITDVNRQMQALTGCSRDELIGAPFKNYFTDSKRAEQGIKLVLSAQNVTDYELTARALDGKETVVSYNATVFYDRDRKLQGVFAAARDVTERRRADENLRGALAQLNRANADLGQASRLKDEFLANMSHELRTPLNAILGMSEALLEQVSGVLNPRQTKSIATISSSGRHLLTLINDILDLSKIEAGKLTLNLEALNTDEFCQSCLAFVRTQATLKQVDVAFEHDGRVTTFVADPKRLKQVLVNLLTNAVKFTPDGGRIGLRVSAPGGEGVMKFVVWDTGIGIAAADAATLFRAFTQIDSGLSRGQEGTGLGLALVSKLVDLHGGSVVLDSEPGKGSRFTVVIPQRALPDPLAAEAKSAEALPSGRPYHRALIIEDDPTSGSILANLLTELGLASDILPRGDGAVEAVLREHPDVIFLDILLPGESGWVVLAKLKEHASTASIPVVVVSFVDEPVKSRALGAVAHFTKPLSRAQLVRFLGLDAARPGPASSVADHRPVVLLAEDNEANIDTMGSYLEDRGYALRYARNGLIAVQLARELKPAAILMDIQMPVMDGLAAIREIRADPTFKATPIIALTALAMPGDRERCIATGATDYMSKPVSLKSLAELLARLLGRGGES